MNAATSFSFAKVIRDHFWYDLLVLSCLLVMIFGSFFATSSLDSVQLSQSATTGFTDLAVSRNSQNLTIGMGSVMENVMFELGWSGDGELVASLWSQFVGSPSDRLFEKEATLQNRSIADAMLFGETQGVVLGATDEANQSQNKRPRTYEISPWMTDTQAFALKERPVEEVETKGFVGIPSEIKSSEKFALEYAVDPVLVSHVEFYIDHYLVTSDNQAPYYLGGDNNQSPNGYAFSTAGEKTITVKVFYASDPSRYLEDGIRLVVD